VSASPPPPNDLDALEEVLAKRGPAARRLRRAPDQATATPIFIDYRLAPDWFEGIDAVIDELEDHLANEPAAVLLLAEHAIARLEAAAVDDSDGHLIEFVPRVERMHAEACERAGLMGAELASHLGVLAEASEYDAFHSAPDTHAQPLGDAGIRALLRGPQRG
jgi:hypothetical protein